MGELIEVPCDCTQADRCPNGRTGMALRCVVLLDADRVVSLKPGLAVMTSRLFPPPRPGVATFMGIGFVPVEGFDEQAGL